MCYVSLYIYLFKYFVMKNRVNYVAVILVAIVAASCTLAVYVQKNNQNSEQKVESTSSVSADSASVDVQFPEQ